MEKTYFDREKVIIFDEIRVSKLIFFNIPHLDVNFKINAIYGTEYDYSAANYAHLWRRMIFWDENK